MTGNRGATRSSMMPHPARCSRATLPKRPVNRQETEVIEVVRQVRKTARAVAIRAPTISYCESFAIANPLRFRNPGTVHVGWRYWSREQEEQKKEGCQRTSRRPHAARPGSSRSGTTGVGASWDVAAPTDHAEPPPARLHGGRGRSAPHPRGVGRRQPVAEQQPNTPG